MQSRFLFHLGQHTSCHSRSNLLIRMSNHSRRMMFSTVNESFLITLPQQLQLQQQRRQYHGSVSMQEKATKGFRPVRKIMRSKDTTTPTTSMTSVPHANESVSPIESTNNLHSSVDKMNYVQLSYFVSDLSKERTKWLQLPFQLKLKIRQKFMEACYSNDERTLNPWVLCCYLIAFRNLEYPWIRDKDIRESIYQKVFLLYQNQNQQEQSEPQQPTQRLSALPGEIKDFSTIIYQFGKNGVKFATATVASSSSSTTTPLPKQTSSLQLMEKAIMNGLIYFLQQKNLDQQSISSILMGLGEMEMEWKQLPLSIQKNIEKYLLENLSSANIIALSSYFKALFIMKFNWNENKSIQQEFYHQFIRMFGDQKNNTQQFHGNAQGLGNIIHILGKAGIRKDYLSKDVIDAFFSGINRFHGTFNEQNTSNICYGLGELGFDWNDDIPEETRKNLENALIHQIPRFNLGEVVGFLIGSVGMKYQWHLDKNEKIGKLLIQRIQELKVPQDDPQSISNIMYSFGKIGIKKRHINRLTKSEKPSLSSTSTSGQQQSLAQTLQSSPIISSLFQNIDKSIENAEKKHVANLLFGLSEMEFYLSDLPSPLKERVIHQIHQKLPEFNLIELAIFLHSCPNLHFMWPENNQLREQVFQQIVRYYGKRQIEGNSREFVGILNSLGKIGLKIDDLEQKQQNSASSRIFLPKNVEIALLNGIHQFGPSFNDQDLSSICRGLGEMKFRWNSLHPATVTFLENTLIKRIPRFNLTNFSGFMKGTSGMQFQWFENPVLRSIIYEKIISFYGEDPHPDQTRKTDDQRHIQFQTADSLGLAHIVYAMGKVGIKQKDLTKDVYKALLHGLKNYFGFMNDLDKNMVLTGFAEMGLKKEMK